MVKSSVTVTVNATADEDLLGDTLYFLHAGSIPDSSAHQHTHSHTGITCTEKL